MKKLFYPLLALSVSGLTGCAPSTFPDMPDDKTSTGAFRKSPRS